MNIHYIRHYLSNSFVQVRPVMSKSADRICWQLKRLAVNTEKSFRVILSVSYLLRDSRNIQICNLKDQIIMEGFFCFLTPSPRPHIIRS
jgi:hypothetical protein